MNKIENEKNNDKTKFKEDYYEKKIVPYERKAHYYETDGMGIVHHSNYIRWFEEARIDFLEQVGFSYKKKMEKTGISLPVLGVSCEYVHFLKFNDEISILPKIENFSGLKMTVSYEVINKVTGKISACREDPALFCKL